jgi:hypothetical protein
MFKKNAKDPEFNWIEALFSTILWGFLFYTVYLGNSR